MLCVLNLIEQLGSVTTTFKTQGMMHKGRYTSKKHTHTQILKCGKSFKILPPIIYMCIYLIK
jgi:hypothetical protein